MCQSLTAYAASETNNATSPDKTVIHDKEEAEILLGRHAFTSYRLGDYDATGESPAQAAIVYEENALYYMAAGYNVFDESKNEPHWGGGSIFLKGIITEIHDKGFTFEGSVDTNYFFNGKWYPCARTGAFKFTRDLDAESRSDHKDDFWRLHYKNPSDEGCNEDSDTSSIDMKVKRMPY